MPRALNRILIYGALILWTIIALFPIYWTFTTTFKVAKDVQLGHIIPWVDFKPAWLGLRAIGLSPDTISSFIFREYKDRSNVGYGTMIAEVYLIVIIIFIALLLWATNRFMQRHS